MGFIGSLIEVDRHIEKIFEIKMITKDSLFYKYSIQMQKNTQDIHLQMDKLHW